MYHDFYGFHEAPFNITPDPRFMFFSERHREAYQHLLFGVRERKGFIQITGEVGAGKTTLCRAFLERLEPTYKTALILNPVMTATQLLKTILKELELQAPRDRVSCLEVLNRFLLEQLAAGNEVVLIVDEAQDLNRELLEQIRLLSNLETDQRKLLQIVLIGQPELRDLLATRQLRQLRQRITVRYHLTPLSSRETSYYIHHRMRVAGSNSLDHVSHERPTPSTGPVFSSGALRRIHRYSGGVPRLINAVCDKALLCGYVEKTEQLGAKHVRRAVKDLEGTA